MRRLQPQEVRQLCSLLFGTPLPDPELDRTAFVSAVALLLRDAQPAFNPYRRSSAPWVDLEELETYLNPQCIDRLFGVWSLDSIVKCLA